MNAEGGSSVSSRGGAASEQAEIDAQVGQTLNAWERASEEQSQQQEVASWLRLLDQREIFLDEREARAALRDLRADARDRRATERELFLQARERRMDQLEVDTETSTSKSRGWID